METDPAPPSLLHKSSLRIFCINPFQTHLFFFIAIFILNITAISALIPPSSFHHLYSKNCADVVPESSPIDSHISADQIPKFLTGCFTGGDRILGLNGASFSKSASFLPRYVYKTETPGILNVQASFVLSRGTGFWSSRPGRFRYRGPRIPVRSGSPGFQLDGYLSQSSGKLCMIGSDSGFRNAGNARSLNVVLKLNFAMNSSILHSLVSGTLESVDDKLSSNYFEPVSILAVSQNSNYGFSLIDKEIENGFSGYDDNEDNLPLKIRPGRNLCWVLSRAARMFQLEYGSSCDDVNCNPLGGNATMMPNFMFLEGFICPDKPKVGIKIRFSNSSDDSSRLQFDPKTTFVAEGEWNENSNRLYVVACEIKNFTNSLLDAFIGDCSNRLVLRFPQTLSISNRSTVVGQIWSNKSSGDPGYFNSTAFRGIAFSINGLPGLKYEYTKIEKVRKFCVDQKGAKHNGKLYPNGYSSDMQFDMTLRDSRRQEARGYLSPLFVGNHFYGRYLAPVMRPLDLLDNNHSSLLNVSYKISFIPRLGFSLAGENSSGSVEISAEGTYNTVTGKMCMLGCRQLGFTGRKSIKDDPVDCEIAIKIQFPPLESKGTVDVEGSIESSRIKSDPLYFNRVQLFSNSIYPSQAAASIWRMDMEITLVLVSNTLACVFVGLQLLHVKKNPGSLPLVSFLMLILLTLGHMIPLLLNFEAFFVSKTNQQTVFLENGGWLEVNEVIVRLVTMVAFLLYFRLLQLAWSGRRNDERKKGLWASEKKVVFVSLPLYLTGGLIAWVIHLSRNPRQSPFVGVQHLGRVISINNKKFPVRSLWGDLRSYAGLLLDGFLLPQIIFNASCNSKDKALCGSFYIGTTLVRLLPHAYDLYRAHTSSSSFDSSFIYANHRLDYYSTAWNIIIPSTGIFLASLVYLQQSFGGRYIIPKRIRERYEYELVPIVSGEGIRDGATC